MTLASGVSLVLVPFRSSLRAVERIERDLAPTLAAFALPAELIVVDNSSRPSPMITASLAAAGVPHVYRWLGRNDQYGPALNWAAQVARYDRLVYVCAEHGRMLDPSWLPDIIAPLQDKKIGMAGCIQPSGDAPRKVGQIARLPGVRDEHIQGGVFAALTATLRAVPYSDEFPHNYSDLWISAALQARGMTLAHVPSIFSLWRKPAKRLPEGIAWVHAEDYP